MGKLSAYPVRIAPPNPFVMRLVSAALLLYASGALLLWMSLSESASYLNPKLQAKLLLVGLLSANALVCCTGSASRAWCDAAGDSRH